jgi:hypothetical protein
MPPTTTPPTEICGVPTSGRPLSAGALSRAVCRPSQALGLILLPNALVTVDAAMARSLSRSLRPRRRTVVRPQELVLQASSVRAPVGDRRLRPALLR